MAVERESKNSLPTTILVGTFIISFCGLVYELLISTVSSYLLGNSVLHFSITIGLFMSFMGVGSYLSKFIENELPSRFVMIETVIGVVGGISSLLLFVSFSFTEYFYYVYFLLIAVISICMGLEIPLATRIIEVDSSLKKTLANVLTFDYIGALIASLIFPLVFLPYLGITLTAIAVGLLNLSVAAILFFAFFKENLVRAIYAFPIAIGVLCLIVLAIARGPISEISENNLYGDQIIYREQSPYQKIIVTRFNDDTRLYLDGSLQFSSVDEHRYHESLVHLPASFVHNLSSVLVIGGGDGMAVREVLKYESVESVSVVDLDLMVTDLGKNSPLITELNDNSLNDPKVSVINKDGFLFLEESSDLYDLIILDLPDPSNLSIGKLYTKEFYKLVLRHLTQGGVAVTQASSPYYARESYWSVIGTLEDVFEKVVPYNLNIPSFGHWGFAFAGNSPLFKQNSFPTDNLKFISQETAKQLLYFDQDMDRLDVEISTLETQAAVGYYQDSLGRW